MALDTDHEEDDGHLVVLWPPRRYRLRTLAPPRVRWRHQKSSSHHHPGKPSC